MVANIGCGMTSLSLDKTHRRMTSSVAWHHCHWTSHRVKLRGVWHAIISLGKHTRSNDIRRGMPSSPLGSTHGRTMSRVASHHRLLTAHTVKQRRAWHAIIAYFHDPPDTQADRDPSRQPAACARGQTAQKWPAGKGAGVQVGSRQRVRRFSCYK